MNQTKHTFSGSGPINGNISLSSFGPPLWYRLNSFLAFRVREEGKAHSVPDQEPNLGLKH